MSTLPALTAASPVPDALHTDGDVFDTVMQFVETHVTSCARGRNSDLYHLAKMSVFYCSGSKRPRHMGDMVTFVRAIMRTRRRLVSAGFNEVDVDLSLAFNEPDYEGLLTHLTTE